MKSLPMFDSALTLFANQFLRDRIGGFSKDISICLIETPSLHKIDGTTCAYFPAFMHSIAMLDFVAGLYDGCLEKTGWASVQRYCKRFLPEFRGKAFQIAYHGFRHKIAHASHPYIVFATSTKPRVKEECGEMYVAWEFDSGGGDPPIVLEECDVTQIWSHATPWPVYYDHRLRVRIRGVAQAIINSVLDRDRGYLRELRSDTDLQRKFHKCMTEFFPAKNDGFTPNP